MRQKTNRPMTRHASVALLLLALVLVGCFPTPTGTGSMSITSVPEGANILLDGEDSGEVTPFVFEDLRAGTYEVTVVAEGYVAATKTVAVERSKRVAVSFELKEMEAEPGTITGTVTGVDGPLAGAKVSIAESAPVTVSASGSGVVTTGEDGTYTLTVAPGTYDVTVEAFGYDPATETVTVEEGEEAKVDFVLEKIPMGTVSGFVREGMGGRNVPGATITAYDVFAEEAVATTTTDASGYYTMTIEAGTYDIIADKADYAQGKRQGLVLAGDDDVEANLAARKIRDKNMGPAVAPTISTFIEDTELGMLVPFEPHIVVNRLVTTMGLVQVEAEYDMYRIQVRIGQNGDEADFEAGIDTDMMEFALGDLLPPLGLIFDAPGDTELIVSAYDYQNNWTEVRIPFTYEVGDPVAVVDEVLGLDLLAFTYGHDLGLYRAERAETFDMLGLPGDPDMYDLGDGTFIDLSRIDKDVTMYTVLRWNDTAYELDGGYYLVEGYEIERSFSARGPWERIAKVGSLLEPMYIDMSPKLAPGKPVYYRVRGLGPNDEKGPWSVPLSVTPLDRWEILLVDPADDATNVSLEPTLRWAYDDIGADEYVYDLFVAGVTGDPDGISGYYSWILEDLVDETEVEYNFDGTGVDLKPAHTYQWNIVEGRAYAYYRSNSVAIAYPWTGPADNGGYSGAANGEFIFTTTSEANNEQ